MSTDIKPLSEQELLREMDVNGINNPTRKARDLLTESEIRCLWTLWLRRKKPGRLRDIYGEYWWSIRGPRKFGRRVRNTVRAGKLPGMKRVGQKSKSHVYDWPTKEETAAPDTVAANDGTFAPGMSKAA